MDEDVQIIYRWLVSGMASPGCNLDESQNAERRQPRPCRVRFGGSGDARVPWVETARLPARCRSAALGQRLFDDRMHIPMQMATTRKQAMAQNSFLHTH